ncbi:bifunctional 3-(3-hydroxy-phenyl)propionate/3-hydroxycinnamic acid hydroxylase [Solirubrobacter ginsenosidimutans]|uniref:Bifunctional 3-(3-hydroxy-phenyl)propionate/3-hydroxycinnamic acid hydroxylase n=1 Tax=Solirubrobacter ginsenosidimutans TaxID=490573 RepID=A0A9X3N4G9_9ACTN|nr:bifunctional 3-(3-hydroxy-phenyl)propionate/3-hydroxycinnamic acid hydroxylase [Solirubrobacter ginsenosidimutans]MDA0166850.1 bifunctional 3-(3-hydroxy-phenyl)propionate/3-hydroxycinnamic acid hydroxylase [Solirubrobacter ginsenosidimutans]
MNIDTDVLVVGYGPVGQTLAALLAGAGHRVDVYERFSCLYDLPRAVYFDDEIMQVWQSLGIAGDLDVLPINTYEWFGADGDTILRMEHPKLGPSGWEPGYLFYQPTLERALDRRVRSLPTATVHCGWSAESLEQFDDYVEVTLRRVREPRVGELEPTDETTTVRARYVIGADGANSVVRAAAGIALDDLGFAEPWLVVDLRPDDIDALSSIPAPCQWCDPVRPHMHTRNGRSHRRFEFMLLPGERPEDFADEARVWSLLAPWFTPDDGTLVRQAVYEFRGRLATTMRADRALLAGDAAHTMPPFMGQGLCSGVRDAVNVAWRLDLILRGVADAGLLDGYTTERRAQNEWIVNLSTEMGRVSCTLDARAAADRDAALRAAEVPPTLGLPPLADGTLATGRPLAGHRAVQGVVRIDRREGRFDDVFAKHFTLLTRHAPQLSPAHVEFLDRLGAHVIALHQLEDLDGRLTAWFDAHRIEAVVVRPDAYVFGAVAWPDEIPALLDDLLSHLPTIDSRITADVR